jgi:hypothetical protein
MPLKDKKPLAVDLHLLGALLLDKALFTGLDIRFIDHSDAHGFPTRALASRLTPAHDSLRLAGGNRPVEVCVTVTHETRPQLTHLLHQPGYLPDLLLGQHINSKLLAIYSTTKGGSLKIAAKHTPALARCQPPNSGICE